MSKFKVGDKIRCVDSAQSNTLTKGKVYLVIQESVDSFYVCVKPDYGAEVGGYRNERFELVQESGVLTPEEVFEHLLKGTKLQYKQEASLKGWRDCSNPQFANILNRVWRIKPEPEVIELNGKKYREIVEWVEGEKMSKSVLRTDNVVFESIEHLNMFTSVEVLLPDNIPDDCNIVCYRVTDDEIVFCSLYKETDEVRFNLFLGEWELSSKSLEIEIELDHNRPFKYIYVRVNQKTKERFTPQWLIGVETDYGYITEVVRVEYFSEVSYFVYTTESLSKEDLKDVHNLKYYISDESDTTVSFTDYVKMFYDGWYNK